MYKMNQALDKLKPHLFKVPLFFACLLMVVVSLVPVLVPRDASAAGQLGTRSLTMTTAQPSISTTYKFTFTVVATGTVQSLKFQVCTTAVGTCLGTAGTTVPNVTSAAFAAQNNWQGAVNFAAAAGSNDCVASSTIICATRSSATVQTATARDISFSGITNLSTVNTSFYARITTYSDAAYTVGNIQDTGTTAGAVTQTLKVTAAVAELLQFCVGSTAVHDATTAVGNASSCSGTTVDLGTMDPSSINYSFTNDNNLNGVAILRTNAVNGSSVSFDPVQDTGTAHLGTLRILGANCTTVPGSCITSKITTQGGFVAGTSDFGMTIAGVNCATENNVYYPCAYTGSGDTEHLVPQTGWMGSGSAATGLYCAPSACNSANGFRWEESGSNLIAAAAVGNVVADEALILTFAGTPAITSTFGPYQVLVDYTALPTY